jgi:hypothetical protein
MIPDDKKGKRLLELWDGFEAELDEFKAYEKRVEEKYSDPKFSGVFVDLLTLSKRSDALIKKLIEIKMILHGVDG